MAQPNASSGATTVRKRELGENTFGARHCLTSCVKPVQSRARACASRTYDTFRSSVTIKDEADAKG